MKVYRVRAYTGAYEDRTSRTIMEYSNVQSALAHARAANQFAQTQNIHDPSWPDTPARAGRPVGWFEVEEIMEKCPYDPGGWVDTYTGVHYGVDARTVDPAKSFSEGLERLKAKDLTT